MSKATIRIPTPLRSFTGGSDEVEVEGESVGDVLRALGAAHDGLLPKVMDDAGKVRPFVNIFVGEQNVKGLQGLDTPVPEGAVLSIVPAVAGGRR